MWTTTSPSRPTCSTGTCLRSTSSTHRAWRPTTAESQQWWYGDLKGRNLGLNAVAGKPPEFFNVDASRYDEMRPGCFDVHERVRDMNAGGQLAGLNFPLDGLRGTGPESGPGPEGQPGHDRGL